eukprot:SAG11_NODE_620_length_8171_cov_9.337339_7_plen_44_part_00
MQSSTACWTASLRALKTDETEMLAPVPRYIEHPGSIGVIGKVC